MRRHKITVFLAGLMMASCGNNGTSDTSDVLVAIGKGKLTRNELSGLMPGGMTEDDSVKFARAYIRSWIDTRLITEMAAKEIDLTKIDRLVDQYRKDLIAWEYNRMMYDSRNHEEIAADSIHSYYSAHPDEFKLTRPMVKGIYIKVANDSESLADLRSLYQSTSSDALDKIEKTGLKGTMHYDYFMDRWIDWEQIESLIPYNFGYDGDTFTKLRRNIDYTDGAYTYLLNITDVIHSGQPMPEEVARPLIEERLRFLDRRAYELQLKDKLFNKALESGELVVNCNID